mmetsp:Transcript_82204/g.232783  ORF Transcript_82204/g.232783 Transcript_82204/m.232783 type:complete len:217 (+) Transcript_82204:1264-1914(+)
MLQRLLQHLAQLVKLLDPLLLLNPARLLPLEVQLMLPQLVHESVDLVAQLPEVVSAGFVILLHPRVVLLGGPQGLPERVDHLLQRVLAALDLGLALGPLVRACGVHVQLHGDALLLHGELVQSFPQALDALGEPVGVHLVVLDLLEVLDVLVLSPFELLLEGLYVNFCLRCKVLLSLPQLLALALRVPVLLLVLGDLGVGPGQLLAARLLDPMKLV